MGGTELCGKKALMPSIQTSAESGWNWVQREEGMEGGDDKWYWEEGGRRKAILEWGGGAMDGS